MLEEVGKLKNLIWEILSSFKIILSAPAVRMDKHNATENNIDFIKLRETNDSLLIKHTYVKENHLDRYSLHLNHDGTQVLAKNLRLYAQKNWHDKDSFDETFTHLNTVKKHCKLITSDLNHESNFVHLVEEYDLPKNNSQGDMLVLQNLRVSYPSNITISHLNLNS